MPKFEIVSNKTPQGDQVNSIKELVNNINQRKANQVLLGATGTGKTFTIANVIERTQKKTLIMVNNKTLASQLYSEFKELFPNNHVEYFVSYFDFFQPEAYLPRSDTYIEKSAKTNQEIEMLRLSTINSLASADDVIVVASVAAIYASVSPSDFNEFRLIIKTNEPINLKQFVYDLVRLQYERNEIDLPPGSFRVKGDIIEVAPGHTDLFTIRISLFDNQIEEIAIVDALTHKVQKKWTTYVIVPANEYIMNRSRMDESIKRIRDELAERIKFFEQNGKLIEAQRIRERTEHDIESLLELGYCNGIENYSRHLELRNAGETPYTIFDYLRNDDWLLVIDESHQSIPQIRGMYNTDRSRKATLVEYGFRLPSAMDNRPLNFDEFCAKIKTAIYVSATPAEWEINQSNNLIVEQIIRPTGLVDPTIEIIPSEGQIEILKTKLREQIAKNERTFVTVLTIRMAEELSKFLYEDGFKVAYLHNELKTLERDVIINDLRRGKYDLIIGINLLREGLDVPEVSLVVIFDADKPGLFRSTRSLIQTIGRAARNVHGYVILFADKMTKEMQSAINETERRRNIQLEYNRLHHITPQTIIKAISADVRASNDMRSIEAMFHKKVKNKSKAIAVARKEMIEAAKNHEYERAAYIRDYIIKLEGDADQSKDD